LNCFEARDFIVITKHGKVAGRIIPEKKYLEGKMAKLVQQVVLHWGGRKLSPWKTDAFNNDPELVSN